MDHKEHLPIIGVGPIIVIPQMLLTVLGIVLSELNSFYFGKMSILKMPFFILGIMAILLGIYLWCSANFKTKVERYITENKLATSGIYRIVRNPIYSAFFMVCTGVILIGNNLILLFIPLVCWIYMTIFLKQTEEKWLFHLHGQEYIDYCKRVNRCIPWFPRQKET